jgi:Niemann-Pick C1 protein
MKKPVRIAVMVIFVSVLAAHVIVIPQIEIGLDQKLSMPEDSYVLKYFKVRKRGNGTCAYRRLDY